MLNQVKYFISWFKNKLLSIIKYQRDLCVYVCVSVYMHECVVEARGQLTVFLSIISLCSL